MKRTIYLGIILSMIFVVGSTTEANAQYRVNQGNAKNVIKRIENGADRFKKSLESGLDRSRLDDTRQEDRINEFVSDFENATDRLRRDWESANLAQDVLRRGQVIDQFMRRQRLANRAERDWTSLRRNLDQLARLYRVTWNWNVSNNIGYANENRTIGSGRYDARNNNGIVVNYNNAERLIKSIEIKGNSFKQTLDRDLDRSRLNGSNREDRINDFVGEFEQATNRLRSDYRDDRGSSAVQEVLNRGKTIDGYMRSLRGSTNSKRQWNSLRRDLDQLASLYRVSWRW